MLRYIFQVWLRITNVEMDESLKLVGVWLEADESEAKSIAQRTFDKYRPDRTNYKVEVWVTKVPVRTNFCADDGADEMPSKVFNRTFESVDRMAAADGMYGDKPPRYDHDGCDRCVFLGYDGDDDIWCCEKDAKVEIMRRHSNRDDDYSCFELAILRQCPIPDYARAVELYDEYKAQPVA